VLTTTSTHFRNLEFLAKVPLDLPPDEFLLINANSQGFFTVLQFHETHSAPLALWDRIDSALEVGTKFGFWMLPSLIAAGVARLGGQVEKIPWAIFVFASRFGSPAIAKFAVSHLHRDANIKSMSPATFDPALFSRVPGIYVAALYRAMGTKDWTTVLDKESDWEEIAIAFKV
jgi:hypothetical protein